MGQPTPGVPVYTVKSVAGGRTRVLHRNLLLPLQGRVRQQSGTEGEGISGSEDEEEAEMSCPRWVGLPGRGLGEPPSLSLAPLSRGEASLVKDASADLKASLVTTPSSPESLSGDEDGSEEEMYTDSLTFHTTASDSTSVDFYCISSRRQQKCTP